MLSFMLLPVFHKTITNLALPSAILPIQLQVLLQTLRPFELRSTFWTLKLLLLIVRNQVPFQFPRRPESIVAFGTWKGICLHMNSTVVFPQTISLTEHKTTYFTFQCGCLMGYHVSFQSEYLQVADGAFSQFPIVFWYRSWLFDWLIASTFNTLFLWLVLKILRCLRCLRAPLFIVVEIWFYWIFVTLFLNKIFGNFEFGDDEGDLEYSIN